MRPLASRTFREQFRYEKPSWLFEVAWQFFEERVPWGLEPTIITYSVMILGSNSTATHSLITRYLRADLLHYKCIKRKIASPTSRLGCLGRIIGWLLAKVRNCLRVRFDRFPYDNRTQRRIFWSDIYRVVRYAFSSFEFKYLCHGFVQSEISERRWAYNLREPGGFEKGTAEFRKLFKRDVYVRCMRVYFLLVCVRMFEL